MRPPSAAKLSQVQPILNFGRKEFWNGEANGRGKSFAGNPKNSEAIQLLTYLSWTSIIRPVFLAITKNPEDKSMRRLLLAVTGLGFGLLMVVAPAVAHHSFAAEYDRNNALQF